jgi:nitrite reductase/ring-hydroxylating ferredoxin subunit
MTEETRGEQPLVGYRTNEEWQNLLAYVAALLNEIDSIPDEEIRQQITGLLQAIDAVHREAMSRLVRLFKKGVLEQVVTDPAIHTLMGMYDLLPTTKPGCTMVWDFLGTDDRPAARVRPVPAHAAAHRRIDEVNPTVLPHWAPAPIDSPPDDGEAVICRMEEGTFILVRAKRVLYVIGATCPHHDEVMTGGALRGYSWICPLGPGCVYDIRDGSRLGGGRKLTCYPVREVAGSVQIGFGIPFAPKLAAF